MKTLGTRQEKRIAWFSGCGETIRGRLAAASILAASLLACGAAEGATCTPPGGIGRTWCVDFGTKNANCSNPADCWVKVKFTGVWQSGSSWTHTFNIDLDEGVVTPEQKAVDFHSSLMTNIVEKCRDGATVCFRLKEDNVLGYVDISAGGVAEQNTGEDDVSIYDPPETDVTNVFQIRGTGTDPAGVARLGLRPEAGPTAIVPTYGLPEDVVAMQLAQQFNILYAPQGLIAIPTGGCIVIPSVPCPDGIHGGASDNTLLWSLEMLPPAPPLNTCEEWWAEEPTQTQPASWGSIKSLYR